MRRSALLAPGLVLIGLLPFGVGRGLAAEEAARQVPVELWDRPRSGRLVMVLPVVREAMDRLLAKPEARLVIRHPPGAEPGLQAEELRAWLVAHAVEPGRIAVRGDLAPKQPIELELIPGS